MPGAAKAGKWNSPFYGTEKDSSSISLHCFKNYVKITFFRGTSLDPAPPEASKHEDVRYRNIREGDEFEDQLTEWVRQEKDLPGEKI